MPVSSTYHGGDLSAQIEAQLQKNVEEACIFVQRDARRNVRTGGSSGLHRITGHLVNSIVYEMGRLTGKIGSNLRYARIHELGGTISAGSGALAVPVHPDARKSGGPHNMTDLTFIPRKGKPPLLVRERTFGKIGGGRKAIDIMFVLLKSVRIPARPYLRPALAANQERIRNILRKGIGK